MKTPLLPAALLSISLTAGVSAATLFGTTSTRDLITFDSATPGTIASSVPITGLVDQFESIAGIDFRPATGQLYALGNAPGSVYRIYTINTSSGVATPLGEAQELSGGFWGFDFNPTVDRIRVVSNTGTNLRFNPSTGALAGTDTDLSTGGVAAVAYDRNDTNPATATTLFGINTTTSELVRIGGVDGNPSPNGGTVTAIGPLGLSNLTGFVSMDIYQDGTAYAAITSNLFAPVRGFPQITGLYTINLATGAASLVGNIGGPQSQITLTGLAAIPEPASTSVIGLAALALTARRRRRA